MSETAPRPRWSRRVLTPRPGRLVLALLAAPAAGLFAGMACLALASGIPMQGDWDRAVPLNIALILGGIFLVVVMTLPFVLGALLVPAALLALAVHGALQGFGAGSRMAYVAAGAAGGLVFALWLLSDFYPEAKADPGRALLHLAGLGLVPGLAAGWAFWAVLRPDRAGA